MICGKYIYKRTFYENIKLWAGAHYTHPKGEDAFWSEAFVASYSKSDLKCQ